MVSTDANLCPFQLFSSSKSDVLHMFVLLNLKQKFVHIFFYFIFQLEFNLHSEERIFHRMMLHSLFLHQYFVIS